MLALGGEHGCLLDREGAVHCWGSHRFGQLGDGGEIGIRARREEPVEVEGLEAVSIAAGTFHVCALDAEGAVWCWGHGGFGQLGSGTEDRPTPTRVDGVRAVALAAGEGHTCARGSDRQVTCWGRNEHGQLGDGTFEGHGPRRVPELWDVVEIAAGRAHTCARRVDGQVLCWGENLDAQLGDGTRSAPAGHRARPAPVEGLEGVTQLALGWGHGCAQTEDGVWCWGRNDSYELGARPGGRAESAVPTPRVMPGAEAALQVAAGSRHTCVRLADGVRCVGLNHRGQLGDGGRRLQRTLVDVDSLGATVDLAAGVWHACAIRADGRVVCWGDNRRGQLGDGTRRMRTAPTVVSGLRAFAVDPSE